MGQGSHVNLHKYLKKKSNLKDFSCLYLLFFFCYQLPPSEIWMLSFFFSLFFSLFGLQKKDFLRREQYCN